MKAIMLCAGYATRLYPLTESKPKALLPLADKPMMNYLVDKLVEIPELDKIFVISNAKFYQAFQDWKKEYYPKRSIAVLNDGTTTNDNRLGAIRDIQFVLQKEKVKDDVIVLASDNYFDFDLESFVKEAKSHKPKATIAVYDVNNIELAKRYGLVECSQDKRITRFLEKPKEPTTTLASTGVYFFPKETLGLIDVYLKGPQNSDAPGHYVKWLVSDSQVFAFSFKGTWYDIGDFESYQKADEEIRRIVK